MLNGNRFYDLEHFRPGKRICSDYILGAGGLRLAYTFAQATAKPISRNSCRRCAVYTQPFPVQLLYTAGGSETRTLL